MIRQHVPARLQGDPYFRWRGGDVSRLEGLSDAVFAFSMTLLIVSLEVPNTFSEMTQAMWQFPGFAFAFAMLLLTWYHHYLYHRRFGFEDFPTFILNGFLLFVILFYVYPLKFMATMLQNIFSGKGVKLELPNGETVAMLQRGETTSLMIVYGCGFVAIFALFALMYHRAWKQREALELNAAERYQTRVATWGHLGSCGIGLLSIALAVCAPEPFGFIAAGWTYCLMGPFHFLLGTISGKRVARIVAESAA